VTTVRFSLLIGFLCLHGFACADEPMPNAKGLEFFEKKIRPALVEHCYKCHSAEANKAKGSLALDTRAGMIEGGDNGPAVVPGEPGKGTLLKALRHDGAVKMPNEQKKLPDSVIADFEAWVKMGAPDPRDRKSVVKKGIDIAEARRHWAYQPVKRPAVPPVKDGQWPANDIDRFVLAQIEAKGLAPAADAAKWAWLRRVSFDLTGLPPTPEEVDAFLKDDAPDAHAKVVDRLLASPRFGEQWARYWLDGVRFGPSIATVDRYRDWVVRAINADLPYDRFVAYQIAGDLLPNANDDKDRADRLAATQFLALSFREMDPVEGMVEVFGQQVLGVSINCAKCHDHKLDAYTQHDYYALAGVFTSSRIVGSKNPQTDGVEVPGEEGTKILATVEGNAKTVGDTNLLIRGEKTQKGPLEPRRFPIVLAGEAQTPLGQVTNKSGRLELATWATSKGNPLVARVFVNRVWQRLFGAAIVRTPNDFGLSGNAPTHPHLLDSLAYRFANEQGWSVKRLVREIAISHTYRESTSNGVAQSADPGNLLVARVPVRRLSYEQIIDNLNSTGGMLTFEIPPRAKNPQPPPRFAGKDPHAPAYRALYHDDAQLRSLFDGADSELITEARDSSVTAPQMLFFMNHPQVVVIAGKVARRAETLAGKMEPDAKLDAVYKLLFAHPPTDAERGTARKYIAGNGFEKLCHVLLCSSEFIYLE
jgi:hypothetical protein